jgi:hypothetical protein
MSYETELSEPDILRAQVRNLRDLISDISEEFNLLDGTCELSQCHHKQCLWRQDLNRRVYMALGPA